MVDAYSPYMAIVARSWLHALEAVSSTLHQKVKYPSGGRIEEIVGNQPVARLSAEDNNLEPKRAIMVI